MLVFADCDFDKPFPKVFALRLPIKVKSAFVALAILIERSIYEKFKEAFVAKVKKLKVGDPLAADTMVGAIASELHFNKIFILYTTC
jgi:NAD-dependent aldehyde dehydrogenases